MSLSSLASLGLPLAACGGADRPMATAEAGADATTGPTIVGPADDDPCGAVQYFDLQYLTTFSNTAAVGIASQYATYVSFDDTGLLYQSGAPVPVDPANCVTGYTATPDPVAPPRCGTDASALHLRATGGSLDAGPNDAGLTSWGMNVGIDLRQNCEGIDAGPTGPNGACYFDATEWTGISFWAYDADALDTPGGIGAGALITLGDPSTAGVLGGEYPFNDLICGNAPCSAGQPIDNHCTAASVPLCLCDPFGKAIGLTGHWTFYTIPFSDMRQKGYGAPEPALDLAHILGFKLSLGEGTWDVWLDNIAFYRPKGD